MNEALNRAKTLPSQYYLDPVFLEQERRQLFYKSWQPIGRWEELESPGDFFTTEFLGEPLLVLRDNVGQVRVLSNVCRHRASLVAQGKGCAKIFQCPYHGWTYDLQGKLRGHRDFSGLENWNPQEVSLPEFQSALWGPYVFAKLEQGGPSFEEVFGPVNRGLVRWPVALDSYRFLYRKDYVVECNWKTYIDNYLEGYHIPFVHPNLFRALDYPKYRVVAEDYYVTHEGPLRNVGEFSEALYYWTYPNFMVNFYPDNMSANIILPLGTEKTLTIFEWFVADSQVRPSEEEIQKIVAFSDEVQAEDIRVCELVQKGLRSVRYDQGRYSPQHENGVWHFHGLLRRDLGF